MFFRYNDEQKRWEYLVIWERGSDTWEPRENFIEYGDSGEEIINQHFLDFESRASVKKETGSIIILFSFSLYSF